MPGRQWSRRDLLKLSAASIAGAVFAEPLRAAAPPPSAVTPALIEAARKEGKLSFYSALELNVAERLARMFEANIRGSASASNVPARSGSSSASRRSRAAASMRSMSPTPPTPHIISTGRRTTGSRPIVPEDVARHFPADQVDPDGMHATSCAWLEAIGYNTDLVKRGDAPKSYADLLDPKWQGKIVKAHPGYSGAILTATFVLARDLGWPYLEKLAQQKVMQVQSAADPPKKILLGERAIMADGNDYNLVLLKDQGKPVEVVYPAEGSPLIIVPSGIFKGAPNPNAARLFQNFFFSAETQQMLVDVFAHRSFHAQVKEKGGHIPLASLKLLKADPAAGAGAERGDQGALFQAFRGVSDLHFATGSKKKRRPAGAPCIWQCVAGAPSTITANSTCRIRPDAGSSRSARLRSSSVRYSCR